MTVCGQTEVDRICGYKCSTLEKFKLLCGKAAGIRQSDRDEEARHRKIPKQLDAQLQHHRVVHAEYAEQHTRYQQEQYANGRCEHEPDTGGSADPLTGPFGLSRTKILPSDRGRRAHDADRRPRDEREELGIAHDIRGLGLSAHR